MTFFLQDPSNPSSPYLLEHVLAACKGAKRGGGAFAWATSMGVQLLLEDSTFHRFLSNGRFDLVIGVDAITNKKTLERLSELAEANPSLAVKVFLHARTKALFHPKVCWFVSRKGGRVIAGSGNLTVGGLRGNWEAFSEVRITNAQVRTLESRWARWKLTNCSILLDPSDTAVLVEAAKNVGWQSRIRTASGQTAEAAIEIEEATGLAIASDAPVLVAEIPKSGNRWNQANFDVATYENYFGARVGTQRRIILRHVDSSGLLEALESRPSVEVASQNYRFELSAASGIAYPSSGRPIAVFIRQPTGVFVYRLLLPDNPGHLEVQSLLDSEWSGPARRVRRVVTTVASLETFWDAAPFWSQSTTEE